MFDELPALHAIRVFQAAGRLLSFKRAAAELHVTPSAVSRQIQGLEDELGTRLFRRLHRGLELTPEGVRYLAAITDALERLDAASRAVRGGGRGARALRLSVLPSFASEWLVPRIPSFEKAHPGIAITMEATTQYADLHRDGIDVAIRFGAGPWPGVRNQPLLQIATFPVCSPKLLRGRHPLRTPADLRHHVWLEEVHVPDAWALWLRAAGASGTKPRRVVGYDNAQLLLQAASAGQGVALAADLLAERLLREGRLVRPFDVAAPSALTYHVVTRPEDDGEPRVCAFREWLLAEARSWERARAARRSDSPRATARAK